jgi:hypothetical protein
MKQISILFLVFLYFFSIHAQDTISFKNGAIINASILEKSSTSVKYKLNNQTSEDTIGCTKLSKAKTIHCQNGGLFFNKTYSQEFSKNSLSYGLGFGVSASANNNYHGIGPALIIGYKRDIWNDRLRFNPNLTIGSYRSGMNDNLMHKYFNSVNLNLSFEFDLLRYKAFSLNVETGGLIGTTNGLKGVSAEYDAARSSDIMLNESEFINRFNYGAILGFGLRISPLKSKYAIKISPLNLHLGNDGLIELHSFISLDIKL